MDLLLSLPFLSYFLLPSSATSWFTTTLTASLFYLNWLTLVLSHPPLKVHLVGLLALRLLLWLLPSLLTLLFDLALPSLAAPLKHGGRAGLPPRHYALARVLPLAALNTVFLLGVEGACSYLYALVLGRTELLVSATLPLPWQVARHVGLLLLLREFLQYHIHRSLLHGPYGVSRLHLGYAHARAAAPFSLQLFADHPLPLVLHRLVPVYVPAALLRVHLLTYLVFVAVCTLEETISMSGYAVGPGIIARGLARRCAVHYAGRGGANFGACGVADWAYGTGRGGDVMEDIKEEADKHNVRGHAEDKVSEGAGVLQGGLEVLRGKGKKKATRDS
ncbi:sterol desaturase family [Cordyceps fumosorosea ARSEF 2679]|uniref:Sterol desaturase family n=1 Tax=Cordyceps fumosorosea (strain ARSEF 2679) TaxID=1081104 RepID=A0A167LP52_CORFA|nr:sterol desaturase family [Cordyceps fumosorosea ARSEF 2679]OAA53323.1 sterol desaturase family [Cordyceps fumosorosea ARSEF 2679]